MNWCTTDPECHRQLSYLVKYALPEYRERMIENCEIEKPIHTRFNTL